MLRKDLNLNIKGYNKEQPQVVIVDVKIDENNEVKIEKIDIKTIDPSKIVRPR